MSEQPEIKPQTDQTNSAQDAELYRANSGNPNHNILVSIFSRFSVIHLTLVLMVVIFVWQWIDTHYQINQMQQELAKKLTDLDGTNKANQTLLTQNQEVVRELGGKLGLLESKYAESQNQRAALEALYQEMTSSRDQTALAEVEQMLMIAGQQLQLSANIKAALIAMQQADYRLQRLDRPALNGLRKSITRDIDKLKALPNVDIAGINLRIDGLVANIDTLPLAQDIRQQEETTMSAPSTEENAWHKFWHELWQESKQLIRVENTEKYELPLLSPTQTFFLRENLKIRFLSAHLSLLSHDEVGFKRDLKMAHEWISLYFDGHSKAVSQEIISLQKLESANINIDIPDITGSIEAVRNLRLIHEKGSR